MAGSAVPSTSNSGKKVHKVSLRLLLWPPKGTTTNRLDGGTLTLERAHASASGPASSTTGSVTHCALLSLVAGEK
jgi:hypothetical protein